ncbi:AGAP003439-PT-like protein [Anopheles sinensis]|uniref:AGAP003439-PT-like protein n=1 Tax=Anopheles sinensis TaxID=74873 RepID=A0A084WSS0_ANOSI|nr:AGAP003439-PT-like protein [Anopheles sinensis]
MFKKTDQSGQTLLRRKKIDPEDGVQPKVYHLTTSITPVSKDDFEPLETAPSKGTLAGPSSMMPPTREVVMNVDTVKMRDNTRPNACDIVKQLSNGHTLLNLVRKRVRALGSNREIIRNFSFVVGQRGSLKIVHNDFTYICVKQLKNRKYWTCSKQRSRKCNARLITDVSVTMIIARNTNHTHPTEALAQSRHILYAPSVDVDGNYTLSYDKNESIMTSPNGIITIYRKRLTFIQGQRGNKLLVVGGYTYARNNHLKSHTIYWACRTSYDHQRCNSRVVTTLLENGLYRILITNPKHTHPRRVALSREFMLGTLREQDHSARPIPKYVKTSPTTGQDLSAPRAMKLATKYQPQAQSSQPKPSTSKCDTEWFSMKQEKDW